MLRVLEETGRVRRGYFAAGLDGRQFALPAAIDRLRAPAGSSQAEAIALAACDPANPYGALLPWPDPRAADAARPSRRAGALVLLWRGDLALFVEAGGKAVTSFAPLSDDELGRALRAGLPLLTRLARRRALRLDTADGAPARSSPLAPLLLASGFRPEHRGLAFEPDRS